MATAIVEGGVVTVFCSEENQFLVADGSSQKVVCRLEFVFPGGGVSGVENKRLCLRCHSS